MMMLFFYLVVLMDLLWYGGVLVAMFMLALASFFNLFYSFRSDPTENDSVEGLRPNARGPGLVTFGVFIFT